MAQAASDVPGRMGATDALFWYLDLLPELRSMIGALVVLDHPPAPERLRADVERVVAGYPRFRQRVVDAPWNLAPPEWVDDARFDLDYHLRRLAVPAPARMSELLSALGPLYASPLDRDRPLWELYATDRLLDGRGAVYLKVHHCLMDGVGATRVMRAFLGSGARPAAVLALPLPIAVRIGRQQTYRTNLVCTNVSGAPRGLLPRGRGDRARLPLCPHGGGSPPRDRGL